MAKLVVGINDLATLHPEVAAEAEGWDPSKVFAGTNKRTLFRDGMIAFCIIKIHKNILTTHRMMKCMPLQKR